MIDTVTLHDDQNLIDHSCNYYSIEDFNNKFNPKSKQTPKNSDNYIDYFSLLHINAIEAYIFLLLMQLSYFVHQ